MVGSEYSELGQYIKALCESHNLSLRQASIRAGLESTTIAKILQRDGRVVPTPHTLDRIAKGLGGDFLHMMRLAGHLPPEVSQDETIDDPELYTKMQRLMSLIRQVAERDRDAAARLMGLVITPFEVMLALEETEEQEQEVAEHDKALL